MSDPMAESGKKPRIAVFSGATATIQNTEPLVTSNKARRGRGLPLRTDSDGAVVKFDALRPQRLAAPVTVYIRQFSAHPLEEDASELYAPPDGYVDSDGQFHEQATSSTDVPVYVATLFPEDGLYPLPYMAFRRGGEPWEDDGPLSPETHEHYRQPFFPDASRLFEEIDRLGIEDDGVAGSLSSRAAFDFYRAAPSGGYKKGQSAARRTDVGAGDIAPETLGEDFFPYRPRHLQGRPGRAALARLTNSVQAALDTGEYAGAIWLEGSPFIEETSYWLNLLIDTRVPIVGNASQRPHGSLGNDGDRNIVDAVDYIRSGIWRGAHNENQLGVVVLQDEQIYTAREIQKADARPGGYVATGGYGGVVGRAGKHPTLFFAPMRRHTHTSLVNFRAIPASVVGVADNQAGGIQTVAVPVKGAGGELLESAMPKVSMVKYGRYESGTPEAILDLIRHHLRHEPLSGIVAEGGAPSGTMDAAWDRVLQQAACSGIPVVKVGRGNPQGVVRSDGLSCIVAGSNLTATKARVLLMACLLRYGALTPAVDLLHPTTEEIATVQSQVARYQAVFDTH